MSHTLDYPYGKVADPEGPKEGSLRVNRGGGWSNDAGYCRAAYRNGYAPDYRAYFLGFRLVRVPSGKNK